MCSTTSSADPHPQSHAPRAYSPLPFKGVCVYIYDSEDYVFVLVCVCVNEVFVYKRIVCVYVSGEHDRRECVGSNSPVCESRGSRVHTGYGE